MMVGRRMPWYSIAVVLFLAYAADQCRSVVRKRTVGNIELEGSYLSRRGLNNTEHSELGVMLGTAKGELKRVVEGASLEVGTESKKDTLLPCLTRDVCPLSSTWYKAAKQGREHTLIHMVYGNKQQNEVVMKEVDTLIRKVWEEMGNKQNQFSGVYAEIKEEKKEGAIAGVKDEREVIAGVGVYTITGNHPIYLGMMDLTWKEDEILVVMGDQSHSFVNFRDGVPEKKVDELPLVFQILLKKIKDEHEMFEDIIWAANFIDPAPVTPHRFVAGERDVLFMYKPPEPVYLDVIGSLHDIMYYVFHNLCNAIVHYKSPTGAGNDDPSNQSFQPFAFTFNYFVISVETENWHTMTVDENVQIIDPVKLEDMYRKWWWERVTKQYDKRI